MKLRGEDRVGLYITVIFHLAVIIILLICQIGFSLRGETTFVLDFTKQEELERQLEELERQQEEENFREDISSRINDLLAAAEGGNFDVRNVAVDRGALRDDRGTDAEQLYRDAERLQQELDNGFDLPKQDDGDFASMEQEAAKKTDNSQKESTYQGPSVVSYSLSGRKASKLSIPAYRCMGAGLVTVIITVNPQGSVIDARIQEETSSTDKCLREFAIRAARLSKFSSSTSAPARQMGDIVYQFIAQ